MMSLASIENLAKEAGERAERDDTSPVFLPTDWVAYSAEKRFEFARAIPNIGFFVPDGFELIEEKGLFVDNSGMGWVGEPALTFEQFVTKLEVGYGYAIVEEGQFQVYVGVFKKL